MNKYGNMRTFHTHKHFIVFFLLLTSLCYIPVSHAFPEKDLWPRWEVNDPLSTATIDHSEWGKFIQQYLVHNSEGINLIKYPQVSQQGHALLNDYVWKMSKIDIDKYNRNEQLAYWLNLYNALVVKVVLEHFPIDSIRDINISPGLFSVGPWGANLIRVKNIALSLDDIAHRIIRPIWNDPRTIYAINNATIGGPNLFGVTFRGGSIDAQLNLVSKIYVNSLRGVQMIENTLITSKIYKWYEKDFGDSQADIITHLKLFAKPTLRKKLDKVHAIDGTMYNWHLNTVVE